MAAEQSRETKPAGFDREKTREKKLKRREDRTISRQSMELVLDRYHSKIGNGTPMTGTMFENMCTELRAL